MAFITNLEPVKKRRLFFLDKIQESMDSLLSKYYIFFIFLLFITAFYNFILYDLAIANLWEGSTVGGWLVSYAAGFVRRGLSGEFFLALHRLTGLELNYLVFAVHAVVFLTFLIFFFRILLNRRITFWYFYLISVSSNINFFYQDPRAIGRQEIIFFALYAFFIFRLQQAKKLNSVLLMFMVIAAFIVTLVHEMFLFYSLYFVFAVWIIATKQNTAVKQAMLIPLSSALGCGLIFLFGGDANNSLLCDQLLQMQVDQQVCQGFLSYPIQPLTTTMLEHVMNRFSSMTTIISLFFGLGMIYLPAFVFFKSNVDDSQFRRQLNQKLLFILCASIPLFIIAEDWGRWVHIHSVLVLLTILLLLKNKKKSNTLLQETLHNTKPEIVNGYTFMGFASFFLLPLFKMQVCCDAASFTFWFK